MPDQDNIINALAGKPEEAPSLANGVRNFFTAPRMQQIPQLPQGEPVLSPLGAFGDALKSWSNTPGFITNALSKAPPEAAFLASLPWGPKAPLSAIRNRQPTAPLNPANDARAGPLSVGGPSGAEQAAASWLRMNFGNKKGALNDMMGELEFQKTRGVNADKASIQELIEAIAILERP